MCYLPHYTADGNDLERRNEGKGGGYGGGEMAGNGQDDEYRTGGSEK